MDGAGHEGAGAASDLLATGIEKDAVSNVESLGAADHAAVRDESAIGNGAEEVEIEGRGEDEEVGDDGLDGEEGGVVESFEVDGAVNGLRGVMEVVADGQLDFGAAFFGNGEARTEILVDGCGVVHGDESLEVCGGHVRGLLKAIFSAHRFRRSRKGTRCDP